jgi:uncharacterized membrane protein YedE/YeeE
MNLDVFTPWSALVGGALIGLAVSLFLLLTGRVTGISGIVGGLLSPRPGDVLWRILFVLGLVMGGVLAAFVMPLQVAFDAPRSLTAIVVAGLLVGFGTRLGNGCTSGHGVCGISRLSTRSIVSTLTFMATGTITAVIVGRYFGGSL